MNLTKYKFTIFLFLSTVLLGILEAEANVELAFNNRVLQSNVINSYPFQETRKDIGLFYDFSWDKNKKQIIIKRDKNNYPVIRFSLFDKKNFPQGISVQKYNDLDLSKVSDKIIKELNKKNEKAKITLNNNKVINLKPYIYDYNDINNRNKKQTTGRILKPSSI